VDDTTVTLRADLAAGLDELAAATGPARSELAEEAVAKFLEYELWARARIEEGLRQADADEFASDEEIARVFGKYRPRI
jgi:RHH-type rel operon transcriptional repressor/antitoxin RelB